MCTVCVCVCVCAMVQSMMCRSCFPLSTVWLLGTRLMSSSLEATTFSWEPSLQLCLMLRSLDSTES